MEEMRAARATGPHNAIDFPQGEKRKYSEPEPQTAEFRTELIATEKKARDANWSRWLDRSSALWLMACVRRLVLNGMSPLNGVPFELNGSRWPAPAIALIQSFGYHHARRPEPGDPLARPATDTPYAKSSMLKRSANGHRQTCVDRRQSRHLHRVRVHGDDT